MSLVTSLLIIASTLFVSDLTRRAVSALDLTSESACDPLIPAV